MTLFQISLLVNGLLRRFADPEFINGRIRGIRSERKPSFSLSAMQVACKQPLT
jgi:hypothetical protein